LIGISVSPRSGIVINTSSRIHPNPQVHRTPEQKEDGSSLEFLVNGGRE
jgi:hypothetical protein